jgi:hypothetical protein
VSSFLGCRVVVGFCVPSVLALVAYRGCWVGAGRGVVIHGLVLLCLRSFACVVSPCHPVLGSWRQSSLKLPSVAVVFFGPWSTAVCCRRTVFLVGGVVRLI